ncbi:hypothetical protein BCV69DRAFT_157549 [Microstroma glucosiphilum]|uniref:GPI transamidase component PIG-S n=1 Tax=Pseudomicrostroma glucosiphilum TaxID=1684307 RepID=A0A316UAI2_9BASI|nr:hypothetical protein BCV69DRAFT_157549 [Pseudomicrostroma glucosiphilum]PWN21858.1 hypothetical protein BCV69DRAFT_157549 [Pseudomicrostroma glucosiphilum]
MSILSRSSQSTSTRVLALAAIYALILISFPYARHLTAVSRLPIDSEAIQTWTQLNRKTGCPAQIPASIGISYGTLDGDERGTWSAETRSQTAALLQLASEGNDRSHAAASRWCVQWQVSWTLTRHDSDVTPDFSYRIDGSGAGEDIGSGTPLVLNLTEPLTNFSPHSVASALAKRIAFDLDLPYKHLLMQGAAESSRTSDNGADGDWDIAAPAAASQAAAQGVHTAPPASDSSAVARLRDYVEQDEGDLQVRGFSLGDEDTFHEAYSQDRPFDLPSRLLLHFHLLNEDLALDNSTQPPLGQGFRSQIRGQLKSLQCQLESLTTLGYTADWGVGKVARGIKWEDINWTANRTWEEQVEIEEEREVECELEAALEEDEGTESADEDDEEGTYAPPAQSPVSRPMCVERYNSTTSVPRSEAIEKRAYYLPQDQMETFVDESGWGLDSQQGAGQGGTYAPFPFLFEQGLDTGDEDSGIAADATTLHFVLYNPSSERRPVVYGGEQDPYEDLSEPATTPASEGSLLEGDDKPVTSPEEARWRSLVKIAEDQEGKEETWGWVVPSWGGVVMLPSHQDTYSEVAELVERQLLTLLGLPLDQGSEQQQRQVTFHLKRLTILNRLRDAIDTLESVHSSLSKLSNLEVGTSVQSSVESSLQALQRISTSTSPESASASSSKWSSSLSWSELSSLSLLAKSSASLAFYNPRMVGQLYFPVEHRYAVFTPLFGPLAVPLLLAAVKEVKKIVQKRRRRAKKTAKSRKEKEKEKGH